jgi:hypothetical protein
MVSNGEKNIGRATGLAATSEPDRQMNEATKDLPALGARGYALARNWK